MISPDIRRQVVELSKSGKSLKQIADVFKIGRSTVSGILKTETSKATELEQKPNKLGSEEEIIISPAITEKMDEAFVEEFANSLQIPSGPVASITKGGNTKSGKEKGDDSLLDSLISQLEVDKPKKAKKAQKTSFAPKNIIIEPKEEPKVEKKVQKTPEDKGRLIAKITMNADTFEIVLKDVLRPNKEDFINALHKKSPTELQSILDTIEFTRSVGNTANQLKHLTFMGASGLELVSKRFLKLKSDGYAELIRAQDKEIESILKEIAMKNADGMLSSYQSPEIRLSTLLVTSLLAVDAKNRSSSLNQTVSNTANYENL